jgi:hypothetical protein
MSSMKQYDSFKDFYPFYLSQHQDIVCRRLHFFGTALVLLLLILFFITLNFFLLLLVPIIGYGFAWVGHFFFEKNKPATFQYPLYSLMGDFVMFKDMLAGKIKF